MYLKKETEKEILNVLRAVAMASVRKIERNNNSWGDCAVYEDVCLRMDEKWKEKAAKLIREINGH